MVWSRISEFWQPRLGRIAAEKLERQSRNRREISLVEAQILQRKIHRVRRPWPVRCLNFIGGLLIFLLDSGNWESPASRSFAFFSAGS
jgi:hypothetical protein